MPKKYPAEVRERAVRMAREHVGDYGSARAAAEAVGAQLDIPRDTLRRWVEQDRIDLGDKPGITTTESEEIKALRKENRRLRDANEILRQASIFFARELDPHHLTCAFIDQMRAQGFAVESVCAALSECGFQIAARTYRAWKHAAVTAAAPAARTVSDAVLIDALLGTAGAPESLYGRRKMTAHLRRQGHRVAACTVESSRQADAAAGDERGRARPRAPHHDPGQGQATCR